MTPLTRRSHAVAAARRPSEMWHDILLFVGSGFIVGGFATATLAAASVGLAMLAYELGRRTTEPDRAYMEGFTDGLTTADALAATDVQPGDRDDVRRLSAVPLAADPAAADGAPEPRQRAAPRPVEQPLDWTALAGITFGDRPARPSPGTYVDEPIRSGPRPPDFPPIPRTFNGDLSASGDGADRT